MREFLHGASWTSEGIGAFEPRRGLDALNGSFDPTLLSDGAIKLASASKIAPHMNPNTNDT